jgi:hypothetical protein
MVNQIMDLTMQWKCTCGSIEHTLSQSVTSCTLNPAKGMPKALAVTLEESFDLALASSLKLKTGSLPTFPHFILLCQALYSPGLKCCML